VPGAYSPPPPYAPPEGTPTSPYAQPNPYGAPGQYGPPGAQPYPGYGYPGYGAPRTNGLAVASLVLGILMCTPYAIGSILAVIFGVIAQNQIKASGGRDGGAGLAKAGLILGCVGIGLWVLFIILAIAGSVSSS
jgi:hypothetical protein